MRKARIKQERPGAAGAYPRKHIRRIMHAQIDPGNPDNHDDQHRQHEAEDFDTPPAHEAREKEREGRVAGRGAERVTARERQGSDGHEV